MIPLKTYDEALADFELGDLLLCRGQSWASRSIRVASLSPYSHAGMLVQRNRDWCVLDVLQWRGGSSRSLRREIERTPGTWDHYKANAGKRWRWDRQQAAERMWQFDATEYGWREIAKASIAFLPVVRWFQKLERFLIDDEATYTTPPFCSMAYAIACEAGGVDPVANLKHSLTTPGDLSRSLFFEPVATLTTADP